MLNTALTVHSLVEGTALSPNVFYPHWSSVENPHSQLKLTGDFKQPLPYKKAYFYLF